MTKIVETMKKVIKMKIIIYFLQTQSFKTMIVIFWCFQVGYINQKLEAISKKQEPIFFVTRRYLSVPFFHLRLE